MQLLASLGSWSTQQLIALAVGVFAGVSIVSVLVLIFSTRRPKRDSSTPDLQRLLRAAPPRRTRRERRTALRRKGSPVSVQLRDAERNTDLGNGWIVDRSLGGICITVDDPIDPDTVLLIRPVQSPDSVPWVEIEVKHCREHESAWELGCQFVRQPSWNVRMLFG